MDVLSERLSSGVDLKGLSLARLRIRGLGRGYISKLVQNGYDSPEALAQLPLEELEKFLPRNLARRVAKEVSRFAEPGLAPVLREHPEKYQPRARGEFRTDVLLVVDKNCPGTVDYRGRTVKLTSKQYWLLAALAENPGKCVPYDVIYKKVWGESVAVETQQISYHKAQLLKKLSKVARKGKAKGLITPVSGAGLVLNLRQEEVVSRRV